MNHVLAALSYGQSSGGNAGGLSPVDARPLLDTGGCIDIWHADAPVREGRTGLVRWRTDEQWLFGTAEFDEREDGEGVDAMAYRAYADVFTVLREHGNPNLLRLWNYLPRITDTVGGMERYRQFNVGRQRAFVEARQAAFDGAPAACALGLRTGNGLSLRFMAGRTPVRAVENPRQVSAYRYPSLYGPSAPTFSRAALAPVGDDHLALLVSGTASIVGHESLHPGDTTAQVDETLRNLRAVFDAAREQCDASFALEDSDPVVYVRNASDAPAIQAQLAQALGGQSRFVKEAVYLEADICRPELLVEIETHACEAGRLTQP